MTVHVAESLRFPPRLEALAQRVADALGGPFNGVHLRVEPDFRLRFQVPAEGGWLAGSGVVAAAGFSVSAAPWPRARAAAAPTRLPSHPATARRRHQPAASAAPAHQRLPALQPLAAAATYLWLPCRQPNPRPVAQAALQRYLETMRGAGFTADVPLYVASGMLGYNDTEGKQKGWGAVQALRPKRRCLRLPACRAGSAPPPRGDRPPPCNPLLRCLPQASSRWFDACRRRAWLTRWLPRSTFWLQKTWRVRAGGAAAAAEALHAPFRQHCSMWRTPEHALLPTAHPPSLAQACTASSWRWLTCWC